MKGKRNKAKLGILLTTSPENENTQTVIRLAEAALSQNKKVQVFLMCDGVYNINEMSFQSLLEKGVEVTLCAHNARQRHLKKRADILFGSQHDLAKIVNESDRFLAFN